MRSSIVALASLLGIGLLLAVPVSAQDTRPEDERPIRRLDPRLAREMKRATRLSTAAAGDTFFIGHVTSGGQLPYHVGRGPYRPGVSREGVWDFEWSASDPDSFQGWIPLVHPNDRTSGTIADDLRPWMALDYGNRVNASPRQGHTPGVVSAWHVDGGVLQPDLANAGATPLWSPLAGNASAWCGLRAGDDRAIVDDLALGGTGTPINGDALIGAMTSYTGATGTSPANFPGYANQWDQMLYRDVRVASGASLTVGFVYQTYLSTDLDATASKCTGWFDKDPLSVTAGNFISSTASGRTGPVDSFMVYVGVPAAPTGAVRSDGSTAAVFDPQRRWFSEVIAVDKPYREILSTFGQDSTWKSVPVSLAVPNDVLEPMLAAQGAADGGGVIRVVFRVKTNKDYSDETGSGASFQSYGYGAVRVDDVTITGCAAPVTSGFEAATEIDNTVEAGNADTPGPVVGAGYALAAWKATGKPPKAVLHTHPILGGDIGGGNVYAPLRYEDLCGPPDSPTRGCNIAGVVVSPGDHDDSERAGSETFLAFHETRQGMLSPTINLVVPGSGENSCGLDAEHLETTADWFIRLDLYGTIFNDVFETGNVFMWGVQSYPATQVNGSEVWGPVVLGSSWFTPYQCYWTDFDVMIAVKTSNASGIPDSLRLYLGREQRCISFGVTTGCSPICGAAYDNVAMGFPPDWAEVGDRLVVDDWDWFQDAFPFNETEGLPGTAAFDTCAALVRTGLNTAQNTNDVLRFDVPGDSVVVSSSSTADSRVDLVFRVLPGPGNYVVKGNRSSGLRRVPTSTAAATPGDGSFWGTYMADPGEFSKGTHAGGWSVDTWNSARCDTVERNMFPVDGRAAGLSYLTAGDWISAYHEDDPKFAALGILKNKCFLVDTSATASLYSDNITCSSVPAWLTTLPPGYTGWDGNQQTREFTKIIPDGLLTAGSHVEYFFRLSHLATPATFVMTPDTNTICPQPDEWPGYDGHRWQQFGVLPDRWKDVNYGGGGSAEILVLDYADGRGDERAFVGIADTICLTTSSKFGAHNGWHCDADYVAGDDSHDYWGEFVGDKGSYDGSGAGNIAVWRHGGQAGTLWDLYQVKAAASASTPAGGIGSRLANRSSMGYLAGKESRQGPTPEMLRTYYKLIVLLSGDLNSAVLGPIVNKGSDDVGILEDFLTYNASYESPRGLWVMGSGFVASEDWQDTGVHTTFVTDYLAASLRDDYYYTFSGNYAAWAGVWPTSVIAGYPFDRFVVWNSCEYGSSNVLNVNAAVSGVTPGGYLDNVGANGPYVSSVYAPSTTGHPFVSLVDAYDLSMMRGPEGVNSLGRIAYVASVLESVLGAVVPYPMDCWIASVNPPPQPVDFLGAIRGNPLRSGGKATLHFGLATSGRVQVRVYDIAGRLVRTLANRDFISGEHTLAWDGTDDQGRAAGRGVYFVRVSYPGGQFESARKLVLLR